MAKDSSLVYSNSASVVDNTSGYFAFSWSGPRIGSRYCDSSFLSKYKNASNTGFRVGGKHLPHMQPLRLIKEDSFQKNIDALLGTRTREPEPSTTTVKNIVARYPLHYGDIQWYLLKFIQSGPKWQGFPAILWWPPFCCFSSHVESTLPTLALLVQKISNVSVQKISPPI